MREQHHHNEPSSLSQSKDRPINYLREDDPRLNESSAQSGHPTKKEQILQLFEDGITDVAEIAYLIEAQPSYIAEVLREAGLLTGYFDLYTTTASEQNIYSRYFRNILAFKDVEAAKQSIEKIDRLYSYFERIKDRAGQHHAMVLALTGKNRARWSGKTEESQIFSDWLATH
jgi:hypothetical protein